MLVVLVTFVETFSSLALPAVPPLGAVAVIDAAAICAS